MHHPSHPPRPLLVRTPGVMPPTSPPRSNSIAPGRRPRSKPTAFRPAEAAARSRRAMGNVTLAREDARDVWIAAALERVWRDVKYGARGLRREPMFALTACLTLAAGMAIATTAFSVVDAELWKPLPFPEPDRLVAVYPRAPGPRGVTERVAGADWRDWRAQSQAFSDLAAKGDVDPARAAPGLGGFRAGGASSRRTISAFSAAPCSSAARSTTAGRMDARGHPERTRLATAVRRRSRGPRPQCDDRRSAGRDRRRSGPAHRPSVGCRTCSSRWIPVLRTSATALAGTST